jgi:hypothetical protein
VTLLRSATDPRWTAVAVAGLAATLADHAHCEKKAAASALKLVADHPDWPELVRALAKLAQEELSHLSYEWTRKHVTPATKSLLGALPFRIDLRPLGGHVAGPTITLVHATPVNNLVYVTEDRPDAFLTKMANQAQLEVGDAICFGHTHKPWVRTVDGVTFINTGSVGRPKDGDWRAGYVLLSASENRIIAEIVRVKYDVAQASREVVEAGLPEEFADFLRSGGQVTNTQTA